MDVRAGAHGERRAIGLGVVFNAETTIGGQFREVIRPGAFDRFLEKAPNILVTFNHDVAKVLGTTRSGTAVVTVTRDGVRYDVELASDDPDAIALQSKLQRRKVTGSSFTFVVPKGGDKWHLPATRNGLPLREIVQAEIYELRPVTLPAYQQTTAAVRDTAQRLRTPPNRVHWNRWYRAAESLVKA